MEVKFLEVKNIESSLKIKKNFRLSFIDRTQYKFPDFVPNTIDTITFTKDAIIYVSNDNELLEFKKETSNKFSAKAKYEEYAGYYYDITIEFGEKDKLIIEYSIIDYDLQRTICGSGLDYVHAKKYECKISQEQFDILKTYDYDIDLHISLNSSMSSLADISSSDSLNKMIGIEDNDEEPIEINEVIVEIDYQVDL